MTITRLSVSTIDEGNLRAVISCLRTELLPLPLPPFFVFPSLPPDSHPISFNPAIETLFLAPTHVDFPSSRETFTELADE